MNGHSYLLSASCIITFSHKYSLSAYNMPSDTWGMRGGEWCSNTREVLSFKEFTLHTLVYSGWVLPMSAGAMGFAINTSGGKNHFLLVSEPNMYPSLARTLVSITMATSPRSGNQRSSSRCSCFITSLDGTFRGFLCLIIISTAPFDHYVPGHVLRILHLVCLTTIIICFAQMRKIK